MTIEEILRTALQGHPSLGITELWIAIQGRQQYLQVAQHTMEPIHQIFED